MYKSKEDGGLGMSPRKIMKIMRVGSNVIRNILIEKHIPIRERNDYLKRPGWKAIKNLSPEEKKQILYLYFTQLHPREEIENLFRVSRKGLANFLARYGKLREKSEESKTPFMRAQKSRENINFRRKQKGLPPIDWTAPPEKRVLGYEWLYSDQIASDRAESIEKLRQMAPRKPKSKKIYTMPKQ
jgi:hypothetical protein